ncbi:MAG TPA: hypothetical protein VFJ82_16430, partial [Longimicrobium sp.]|nr:hypothetical protein [Longimicrobium sp.]
MILRSLALLVAAALLGLAPRAAAQVQPPPVDGDDSNPPTITFTPASGTAVYTSPFTVKVGYCDDHYLGPGTVADTFNNAAVGPSYAGSTRSGCASYGVSTLTLTPQAGTNTLKAHVCDLYNNCSQATATYTYAPNDAIAPTFTVTPAAGPLSSPDVFLNIAMCDERKLGTAYTVTLNGTDITASLVTSPNYCPGGGLGRDVYGQLLLKSGTNTLVATAQDSAGNTGTSTTTWTYTPKLDTSPTNQTSVLPQFSDVVLSYSMPGYRSLDQNRAVTLVYSSLAARPFITVQLDVTDNGSTPAPTTSFHVTRNGATWALPDGRTSDMFYQSGQGGNRLTAVYGATNMATGSYNLTAVVTRWMSGGGTEELTAPVRALVLNESASRFGAGWNLAGLERVIVGGDGGILVVHGDGTATFYPAYTSCNAQKLCTFGHSPGEFGTMAYDSASAIYVRTERDGTRATFNAAGFLLNVKDRLGLTQSYGYDSGNRLVSITDPAGLVTTLAYDINGKISTITDPAGRVSVFTVNASGDLVSIRDPDNVNAMTLSYGANRPHRVDWYTDRAGRRSDVTYDAFGRAATLSSPAFTAEQNQSFRLAWTVTSMEAAAEGSYTGGTQAAPLPRANPATLRVQKADPEGRATRFALDPWGVPLRVEDPRGRVATATRNAEGQTITEVDTHGNPTTYTWSGGDLASVQSSTGTVNYTYDANGNL